VASALAFTRVNQIYWTADEAFQKDKKTKLLARFGKVSKSKLMYVPLHCHSEYSYLDSVIKIAKYAERAVEIGFPAIGVTDHGVIDGLLKLKNECRKKDVIPILGCELYFVTKYPRPKEKPKVKHVVALAKSMKGFASLCRILSEANKHLVWPSRPLIDAEDFFNLADDLVVSTACAAGLLSYDDWKEVIEVFKAAFGDDLYAEVMPLNWAPQFEINKRALKSGLPIIPSTDAHYLDEEDSVLQEVFLAIQKRQRWNDADRFKFSVTGLNLKSPKELISAFKNLRKPIGSSVIKRGFVNSFEIAEKCAFEWKNLKPSIPQIPELRGCSRQDELNFFVQRVWEGLKKKGLTDKAYEKQAKYEMGIIARQGFVRYFLIVWRLHNWAREQGIFCGIGRGSVGSSLVAYALDFTKIDPLKFALPFARFISPDRADPPDVDMDFEDARRADVIKHLEEVYGIGSVSHIGTVGVLRAKAALKDTARVFDVPLFEVNEVTNKIVVRSGGDARADFSLEDSFKTFESAKKFKKKYPKVCNFAQKLEGLIKNPGVHAAGIILSPKDLFKSGQCVLAPRKNFPRVCNWDRFDIEERGLIKFDVLGLSALSRFHDARDLLAEKGIDFDIDEIALNLDDKKIFEAYSKGDSIGAFQMTGGVRKACQRAGIEKFTHVVDMLALYRPGTLRTGWLDDYIKRKCGEQKIPRQHPLIAEITKETYGIFLYQEQVMKLLTDLAGFPPEQSNKARRTITKAKGVEEFKRAEKMFIKGCKKRKTLTEKEAKKLFESLKHWGSYGFSQIHATEYALISYLDMWLRVHYPGVFFAAALSQLSNEEKISELVRDAVEHGFKIALPDINLSSNRWVCKGKQLFCPLNNVKGLSEKSAQHIIEVRKKKGKFKSVEDFYNSVEKRMIHSGKVKKLLLAGAFDKFGVLKKLAPDQRVKIAEENLAFKIDFNPFKEFAELLKFLDDQLGFVPMNQLAQRAKKKKKKEMFIVGVVEEVKFTYPKDIEKKLKKGGEIWGGIYARVRDKTSFTTVNFSTSVYKLHKEALEKAKDECIIALGNKKGADNFAAKHVWFLKQISAGKFEGLPVGVDYEAESMPKSYLKELRACEQCKLHAGITQKVPIEVNNTNFLIVAEAPGAVEDAKGNPLIGKAGKKLQQVLGMFKLNKKRNFKRTDFSYSNINKCRPPENRKPTATETKKCLEFFRKEIEHLKPKAILVLGATALEALWPKSEGCKETITNLNATVQFSEKWKAWLSFCIHPASVLYQASNLKQFKQAIETWTNLVKYLRED